MEPLKEFSSTKLTLYNCVIPEDRLRNTPSSKDGMCHDTEIDLRMKGCECIQSAGLLLKLPQVCNCVKSLNSPTWALIGIVLPCETIILILFSVYFTGCHGYCTSSISSFLLR